MATILVQGGSTLYKVDPSSGVATALTLPTGITLSTARKPRFAVLNQFVAMVNSPTRNLAIDPEGNVRVMVPKAPTGAPNIAAGTGTGPTGTFKVKSSFIVRDSGENIIMESGLGPASQSLTLTDDPIAITSIPLSEDSITARRLYRTLSNGSLYFFLGDLEGNVGTSMTSRLTDAQVSLLLAQPQLGGPPGTLPDTRLKFIVSWKQRLWAISDDPALVDNIYGSDTNRVSAWPILLVAAPTGFDAQGCVSLAPRKDQLGVLKRNGLWQITGRSSGTGIDSVGLSIIQIAFDKAGCIAPDSVVVINDRVYWLGHDGIYEWGPEGVSSVSVQLVHPWFTTDTYFNRTRFGNAFAKYNAVRNQYELHLAAVGSSSEDRWIAFNLTNRKFYGPHKTALFTPSHSANTVDSDGLPIALVGGTNGIVYTANSANFRDGAATAIDFDCFGPFHGIDAPDVSHYWGELSVLSKVESGGVLTITPYVGRLNASAETAISHDLTLGRELLRRLGDGPLCRLRFQQATVNQGVSLYGYDIPNFENGRR